MTTTSATPGNGVPVTDDSAWIAAERDHEWRMEKEKTRQADIKATARTERIQAVAVAVGVIAVVGIITGAIWTGLTQSSERRQEQIIVCTESGGTMVDTTGGPLCLRLQEGTAP